MVRFMGRDMGGPALQVKDHWVSLHKRVLPGWLWWWQPNGVQWPFMHTASQRMRRARSWQIGRWQLLIIPMKEGA